MVEQGPIADATNIDNIPSDIASPWKLSLLDKEDIFLQFQDSTAETDIFFLPIRFRRSSCGPFFMLAEELSFLPEAFMKHGGQIFPRYENQSRVIDAPSTFFETEVRIGKNHDESKYIIKRIPDGDTDDKSIDIEITRDGNAIVTMHDNRRNNQALIEFKTGENGGKYPIMAEVFTRIAKRIANAKKG